MKNGTWMERPPRLYNRFAYFGINAGLAALSIEARGVYCFLSRLAMARR